MTSACAATVSGVRARARVCRRAAVCVPHTVSGRTYTLPLPGPAAARRSRTSGPSPWPRVALHTARLPTKSSPPFRACKFETVIETTLSALGTCSSLSAATCQYLFEEPAKRLHGGTLEDVGFTSKQLRECGYTTEEMGRVLFQADELRLAEALPALELRGHLGLSAEGVSRAASQLMRSARPGTSRVPAGEARQTQGDTTRVGRGALWAQVQQAYTCRVEREARTP